MAGVPSQHGNSDIQMTETPLDEDENLYAHRPRNQNPTLPFYELYRSLFNPLNEARKKPTGPAIARRKQGPHGPSRPSVAEARTSIVDRFVSRWRKEVGNDIYPAFRLIVPDKDRDRGMYGLKEKTIGKLLVRILKINKDSEDGFALLNWKLPGQKYTSNMAGDFAGRCYEVISKRAMRSEPGGMLIEEVNERLDALSLAQKEDLQLPILEIFYSRMNAEELMWLIRIILRQMKIGASERTLFHRWHPDAELLFNVSSDLKRVCWELVDENIRLDDEKQKVEPMQCFQPQLAAFTMNSLDKVIQSMQPSESKDGGGFWIEEKLDGERMQLHMVYDKSHPGEYRFAFWSRKAKDYTYLYGNGFEDDGGALTRHLRPAFAQKAGRRIDSIILDGEMVTWDVAINKIQDFGHLKTAANAAQKNEYSDLRPLYKVFDIIYLNGKSLLNVSLQKRHAILKEAVKDVEFRMEVHKHHKGQTKDEIETELRKIVEEGSEGLVIKNPRSLYHLNQRNEDWVKVKPEYMSEFGEELDLVVIGGYYGSGHRGGGLSSFLCGLRASDHQIKRGYAPGSVISFCKVGGGMTASDYAAIRHITEGKWRKWDRNNPPKQHIRLDPPGMPDYQPERPDVWIMPSESFVVSVKGASVLPNVTEFGTGFTLRFPRFKNLRQDKRWDQGLSVDEFQQTREVAEQQRREKQFVIDDERKKKRARSTRATKKELVVAGQEEQPAFAEPGDEPQIFAGLSFYIMSESKDEASPAPDRFKKSKAQLEAYVKQHGGKIFQSARAADKIVCVADRPLVSVVAIQRQGTTSLVRPRWLHDCVRQATLDRQLGREPVLLPWEPRHMFYVAEKNEVDQLMIADAANRWGDGYARDFADTQELARLLESLPPVSARERKRFDAQIFKEQLARRGFEMDESGDRGDVFSGCVVHFAGWKGPPKTVVKQQGRVKEEEEEMDDDDAMEEDGQGDESFACDTFRAQLACNYVRFGNGAVRHSIHDKSITHVVVVVNDGGVDVPGRGERDAELRRLRRLLLAARRSAAEKMPRLVTAAWVEDCFSEGTRIDEERYAPR